MSWIESIPENDWSDSEELRTLYDKVVDPTYDRVDHIKDGIICRGDDSARLFI